MPKQDHRSPFLRARLMAVVAMLLSTMAMVAADEQPAGAVSCAPPSTKQLSGTLLGEDGRYLSALIGVELFDSQKRPIDAQGCLKPSGGYSHLARLNETGGGGCCFLFDHEGSTSGESSWAIPNQYSPAIPANAAYAWIEAYPKSSTAGPNGHGTSYERYGGAMRRYVPITSGIHLRMPLGCGLGSGGDNGTISGRVYKNGRPIAVNWVAAWSRSPDTGSSIMGFGQQNGSTDGTYRFRQAAPNQRYAMQFDTAEGSYWFEHDYGDGVPVSPCSTTSFSIDVGYNPPREVPTKKVHGTDTVGIRRGNEFHLRNSNTSGSAESSFSFGTTDDVALVGDWNGDGTDTPGVRRGRDFLLSNDPLGRTVAVVLTYGRETDTPVVGDWDGNGTDTIGVRRGNSYYLRNTNNSGPAHLTFGYGKSTDTPVTGDWDGNGTDTPGIRRGNGYYLRNTNNSGPAHLTFGYGKSTDTPVTGDWDGNGTDTPGIRRGNGYYLRNTNNSGPAHLTFGYGTATDTPVTGDWDGR